MTRLTDITREIPKVKIETKQLCKSYVTEQRGELPVFTDVNCKIHDQELVTIIGPSGCGKTTLLLMLAGLVPITSGTILVDGREVKGPGRDRGVVFQADAIFMWRTVLQNVEYGLEMRAVGKEERRKIALEYLKMVNLDGFADFYPKELSGGMKKRVAIAAVFANDPAVLLMDEPFGSLDYPTKIALQSELVKIWEQEKKTMVFVTHDLEEALFLSDRILAMANGRLETTFEVPFERPRSDQLRISPQFQEAKGALWKYLA